MLESSVFSIMLTGQKKLPKYFAQKSFIYKAIYFSGLEFILSPNLALVNCKALELPATHPNNAISMATK